MWSTDHGDGVACHGGHYDKIAYMPEEMLRIPFAMRYPEVIPAGQKCEKLVSNIDLAPTFLDTAGTRFENPIDGKSLLPLVSQNDVQWREDLMCETHGHGLIHLGRILITQRYKYVWNDGDMDELYDLEKDPYELKNLIQDKKYSDLLVDMKNRLEKWREKTRDDITKKKIMKIIRNRKRNKDKIFISF